MNYAKRNKLLITKKLNKTWGGKMQELVYEFMHPEYGNERKKFKVQSAVFRVEKLAINN